MRIISVIIVSPGQAHRTAASRIVVGWCLSLVLLPLTELLDLIQVDHIVGISVRIIIVIVREPSGEAELRVDVRRILINIRSSQSSQRPLSEILVDEPHLRNMSLARHGRLQLVRLVLPMSSKLIRLCVSWGYILDLLYLIGVSLSFKLSAIAHFHFLFDLRGYRWLYNLPVPLGCSRLAANRRFLMYLPY
jgi:hypothetical protein